MFLQNSYHLTASHCRQIVNFDKIRIIIYGYQIIATFYKVNHARSSPGHQQSNGKAEAAVKIVKILMKKTVKDGRDQFEALLEQRNTPRQDTDLLFNTNT
jgi:hypothetical protein